MIQKTTREKMTKRVGRQTGRIWPRNEELCQSLGKALDLQGGIWRSSPWESAPFVLLILEFHLPSIKTGPPNPSLDTEYSEGWEMDLRGNALQVLREQA